MHKIINLNNPKTIETAIKQLQNIRQKKIPDLLKQFLQRLGEAGIEVGRANAVQLDDLGEISDAIAFRMKLNRTQYGYDGLVIVSDVYQVLKSWKLYGDVWKTVEVSPLLMAEFGSGKHANTSHMDVYVFPVEAGRGTFPGQKHADEEMWVWTDETGRHKSSGIQPTMPVYKAYQEMGAKIDKIAKDTFKGL